MGILESCVKEENTSGSFCIVGRLEICKLGNDIINNEFNCPLLELSHRCDVIESSCILDTVSIIHECGPSCRVQSPARMCVEREKVTVTTVKRVDHDNKNTFYCFNVYCVHNTVFI